MRASGKVNGSTVDGPGYNYVLFMQGCSHHCKDCHNPDTWDFKGGYEVDLEDLRHEIINNIYTGVTLSGGDPMDAISKMTKDEFGMFLLFIRDLKRLGLNIICYTGYYYGELTTTRQTLLLDLIDVLIDGPFEVDNKKELPFRGSSNQNVIPLSSKGKALVEAN